MSERAMVGPAPPRPAPSSRGRCGWVTRIARAFARRVAGDPSTADGSCDAAPDAGASTVVDAPPIGVARDVWSGATGALAEGRRFHLNV